MWKTKLILNAGESVVNEQTRDSGSLGNDEVTTFEIRNDAGTIVGSGRFSDFTSIKAPFRRTFHLQQYDMHGKSLVNERGAL